MALKFSALLQADAKQAKAEVDGLRAKTDELSGSLDGVRTDGAAAKDALDGLGAGARSSTTGMTSLGAATGSLDEALDKVNAGGKQTGEVLETIGRETRQTTSLFGRLRSSAAATWARIRGGAQGAGDSTKTAAGSVANLTAQFNDIGVMMAAGQNPLQLALQQGTQISQVIGPMGAAGAARALGSAFMGLLSPVSLVTVGSIAAAGAMSNWLTGSADEAMGFDDSLGDLNERLDNYRQYVDLAKSSTKDLEERFGSAAEAARDLLPGMAESRLRAAQQGVSQTVRALIDELGLAEGSQGLTDRQGIAEELGVSLLQADSWDELNAARTLVEEIIASYAQLGSAADASAEQQLEAAKRVREAYIAGAELSGGISSDENARIMQLEELIERIAELQGQVQPTVASTISDEIRAQADAAAKAYIEHKKNTEEAEALLATMREQNAIQQASLRYGEDSVQAENARANAARREFEERWANKNISEEMKELLREQLEHQLSLEAAVRNTDLLGLSDQAALLATNMGVAADEAERYNAALNQSAGMENVTPDSGGLGYGGLGSIEDEIGWTGYSNLGYGNLDDRPPRRRTGLPDTKKTTTSRRGSGSRSQVDAVAELIAREQEELDILRELDPVQKEMIRNREVLKEATAAERAAIAEVIGQRIEEQTALEETQAKYDFFRETGFDMFTGLTRGGDAATASVERLGDALYEAAMQALLLGQGPLASILGGGESGGLLGQLAGAIGLGGGEGAGSAIPTNADGGMQYGPGGSRADKGLTWISPGEFIVNARATEKHRAMLEAINSGAAGNIPAMASGGMFGAAAPTSAAGGMGGSEGKVRVELVPTKEFDARIRSVSQGVSAEVVKAYDRDVLPTSMQRVSSDPRRIG